MVEVEFTKTLQNINLDSRSKGMVVVHEKLWIVSLTRYRILKRYRRADSTNKRNMVGQYHQSNFSNVDQVLWSTINQACMFKPFYVILHIPIFDTKFMFEYSGIYIWLPNHKVQNNSWANSWHDYWILRQILFLNLDLMTFKIYISTFKFYTVWLHVLP